MDGMYEKFDLYTDSEFLQNRLESTIGKLREGVAVSYVNNGISSNASINQFTIDDSVQTGCIAKLLTATLVAIARHEHKIRFEDNVIYFFDDIKMKLSALEHLSHIKIYHLLNHSHGLDHSILDALPVKNNGRIDVITMLKIANNTDLNVPPGALPVYSNIGSWLVGAILECVYGQPYSQILNQKLFKPLDINALKNNVKVCPSVGGELRLSTRDFMKIMNLHMHGCQDLPGILDHLIAMRTQFPAPAVKWFPMEVNFCPGWIDFGNSFGQLGFGKEGAVAVRFLPDHDTAIVVTSTHQKLANFALASLFKEILNDFNNMQPPLMQHEQHWAKMDLSAYHGIYDNSKYRLLVNTAVNGLLRVQVFQKNLGQFDSSEDPYIKRFYHPATAHTFISIQPEQLVCPVLQFSNPRHDGLFQYVNTGKFIFTRIGHT